MAKKSKKVTRSVKSTKVVRRSVAPRRADTLGSTAFLFRRIESPVTFTLVVSCAAFAVFMATVTILRRVDDVLLYQDQLVASMYNSAMGQVAGVSTSAQK